MPVNWFRRSRRNAVVRACFRLSWRSPADRAGLLLRLTRLAPDALHTLQEKDGLTPEQRRERDKKALEEKAARKAAEKAAAAK